MGPTRFWQFTTLALASLLTTALCAACGEENASEPPPNESQSADLADDRETATVDPSTPGEGLGHLRFTVEGGIFPTATDFNVRSENLRALLSSSSFNLMQRPNEIEWSSEDGAAHITSMIFSISEEPAPGSFSTSQYRINFGLSADQTRSDVKTVVTTDEEGTVTITERTDGHIIGNFDVRARATQVNSTEPTYRLRGTFAFAR